MSILNIEKIIKSKLSGNKIPDFLLYENVTSTNDLLKDIIHNNVEGIDNNKNEGFSVIALSQSHGKGRSGRTFFSPKDCSIYLSILLKPDLTFDESLLITPMAAAAVHEAIKKVCNVDVGIKWVNDLYFNNRKICGILTEGEVNSNNKLDYAIVGIGVNVFFPTCKIPEDIKDIYGTIYEKDVSYNEKIIGELASEIILCTLDLYKNITNRKFIEIYRNSMFLTGKKVAYQSGEQEIIVTVNGIDEDAHLIVTDESGKKRVLRDGEVRLKMLK